MPEQKEVSRDVSSPRRTPPNTSPYPDHLRRSSSTALVPTQSIQQEELTGKGSVSGSPTTKPPSTSSNVIKLHANFTNAFNARLIALTSTVTQSTCAAISSGSFIVYVKYDDTHETMLITRSLPPSTNPPAMITDTKVIASVDMKREPKITFLHPDRRGRPNSTSRLLLPIFKPSNGGRLEYSSIDLAKIGTVRWETVQTARKVLWEGEVELDGVWGLDDVDGDVVVCLNGEKVLARWTTSRDWGLGKGSFGQKSGMLEMPGQDLDEHVLEQLMAVCVVREEMVRRAGVGGVFMGLVK